MARDRLSEIDGIFKEHLALLTRVQEELGPTVAEAADRLSRAYRDGHKVLLFGNGGSASDALHIEGELVNRFRRDRPGLPALALGASLAALTSTANDYAYDDVFARLLEAHGCPGDLAIGLSTSGRSRNVMKGLTRARELGLSTLALTGADGGVVGRQAELLIAVPSQETARIQEAHIVIGHIICQIVEDEIFGDRDG